jgi:class 3 adenylate cyclase/tetratricopeptide (TPR) repeat protein
MICPRCQQDNPPHARFCLGCGARLALACGSCGAELPGGARFCLQCGQAVTAGTAASVRSLAPETYTPKHLAEKILTSRTALEGERKQVTVLFADLKGSMELLADRDPEDARKLLDPVLENMMEAVHRFEGTVNQVMGDGIMALFGAPLAHEDHAVRACYAALRMQESVKRYAEGVFRTYGVPVQIRVGLNSGEVVVRAIGSDLHMDYSAIGQTTHLAARMEQMAQPGAILLTPETLALAEGFIQVTSRGPVPVKGAATPIEIFELSGASPVRSRLHAAASRGLTRFVGRDAEIELLRQALGRAGDGHGQVVAVVGEPGVGKSRLVWEFTHSHRSQGWLVVETASVSYGKATMYFPVIELLRRYFALEVRDDVRRMREKVTGKLLSLDRSLEHSLPVFLSLLDVPVEDAEWASFDPPQRRRKTLDALKRLVLRESQVQPVLLVVEDLHWIDAETQAFLDLLVESVPTARLLLLVNYRPEYEHAWGRKTYYQQIRLDALPTASAGELLGALLGEDPELSVLGQILIERTQGNPFFLEESVRSLVEIGALTGERGAYRLMKPIQSLQLPATVHAILAARIDRLAPGAKRLLQAAAVLGKDVPYTLLQAIAEEPEETVRHGLGELQAAEFLYEACLFPELEYTFKHALTHEVVYGGLLLERRRALHARILTAIEVRYPDRLDEQIERLAHHAVRGEQWEAAIRYAVRAGMKAALGASYRGAVAAFEEALKAIDQLPERRELMEQAIDIRFRLRNSLQALGEMGRVRDHLERAESLVRKLDDRRRLGRVASYLGNYYTMTGNSVAAIEWLDRALHALALENDVAIQAEAIAHLAMPHYFLGNLPQSLDWAQRSFDLLQGHDFKETLRGRTSVFALTYLAFSLADQGDFVGAIARGEEGVRVAEALGHAFVRVFAYLGLGVARLRQGEFEKAVKVLEPARQLCEEGQFGLMAGFVSAPLGLATAGIGDMEAGLRFIEDALTHDLTTKITVGRPLHLAYLAEARLLGGDHEGANDCAANALGLAREQGSRLAEAHTLRVKADIDAATGEVAAAETTYKEALSLGNELGMRPLVAHCHLGLGTLSRRAGKRQQAQEHLRTATTMYREMDMRFWLEQAAAIKECR